MAKFKPDYSAALKSALKASSADEDLTSEVETLMKRWAKNGGHTPQQIEAIAQTVIARSGLMTVLQTAIVAEIVRAATATEAA